MGFLYMKMNQRNVIVALLLCGMLGVFGGCGKEENNVREDLAYTVCEKTKLPDILTQMIEEKKQHAFNLSYVSNDSLYIVVGYGAHDRENLRVVVEDLYKTDRAIYVKTELETCEESEESGEQSVGDASMYPYIVIQCERMELPVIFD